MKKQDFYGKVIFLKEIYIPLGEYRNDVKNWTLENIFNKIGI